MTTLHTASAHGRLPSGAHRRLHRATCAAARTEAGVHLLAATVALLALALGLGSALRSATHALDAELSRMPVETAAR